MDSGYLRPESFAWKKFISLDGENSHYTTVLLICMNLAVRSSFHLSFPYDEDDVLVTCAVAGLVFRKRGPRRTQQ